MGAIIAFFVGLFIGGFVTVLSVAAFNTEDPEYNERNDTHR